MQIVFDHSKALTFLGECSQQFESILDAEDSSDGPSIEGALQEMTSCEERPIVKTLVNELFHKANKQVAAEAWPIPCTLNHTFLWGLKTIKAVILDSLNAK